MKLLIDIPEHIYEHAKETTEDSRDEFEAMRAIANGSQQRTGRWVWDSKSKVYRCSCCKRFPWRVEYVTDHDEIFEDLTRTNAYKYCPACGTKMEVEE